LKNTKGLFVFWLTSGLRKFNLTGMNYKAINILLFVLATLNPSFNAEAQKNDSTKAIFSDDFSKETIGKFPAKWISNRPGEVVAVKNRIGKWLKMHAQGTYLPILSHELPQTFTIEFDYIHQTIGNGNNTTELTIFNKPAGASNDALFPGTSGIRIIFETFIVSGVCYDNLNPAVKATSENRAKLIQVNSATKITIKVEQQQLVVLVNGSECLHVPKCNSSEYLFNAIRFQLWESRAEPLISNFLVKAL
jgi:hypothetical protein